MAAWLAVMACAEVSRAQVAPAAPDTIAIGDWRLAPLFQVRVRGQGRHDLDAVDRGMAIERARLGLDALGGAFEARVVLQDARAVDLTVGDSFVEGPVSQALTGAYEAWAEAHTASIHPSFVRVGRQPITWGEGRLLGVADWSPTARSLDAVRARLAIDNAAFELLAAAVEAPSQTAFSTSAYAALFGVRAQWAFDPLFAAEAYGLARLAYENPPPPVALDGSVQGQTYTAAARLYGATQAWTWGVEGAYQFGHVDLASRPNGTAFTGRRIGWAGAAHVAHRFDGVAWTPTVGAGAAYASGDRGSGPYRAFDPLLPDVHVWHGAMDVFAWTNEEEVSGRVSVVPWTDAVAAVEYRYARLAQPQDGWRSAYLVTIGEAPDNSKVDLGHEVDLSLRWSPWAPIALEAGYSFLLLGAGARALVDVTQAWGAAHVSHFAYLQVQADF
jgi:hypothetical protein